MSDMMAVEKEYNILIEHGLGAGHHLPVHEHFAHLPAIFLVRVARFGMYIGELLVKGTYVEERCLCGGREHTATADKDLLWIPRRRILSFPIRLPCLFEDIPLFRCEEVLECVIAVL